MKRIIAILILCFLVVGCDYYNGLEPISKPYYGQFISSSIYEDENGNIFAKIWLENSEDIPEFTSAEFYISGVYIDNFQDRFLYYYPDEYGEFQCHIIFKLIEGEKILYDMIILY